MNKFLFALLAAALVSCNPPSTTVTVTETTTEIPTPAPKPVAKPITYPTYAVLVSWKSDELEAQVNRAMANGWQLGQFSTSQQGAYTMYSQTMWRERK